jgi:hypothetical protein
MTPDPKMMSKKAVRGMKRAAMKKMKPPAEMKQLHAKHHPGAK